MAQARRLRILIVTQYFPPEIGATQFRMQAFAEHLASHGHDVTVIAEFPNHPHGIIPQEYRGKLFQRDSGRGYRILRVWVNANPEKTQRTRLSFYLSFMLMAIAISPLVRRPDVILATTPPLFTGVAGLLIGRFRRAPFVLDVRDLWPAAATSLGQISGGAVTRLAEELERGLYRHADRVVAVTRPFCEHVDRLRSRPDSPTILVPNGTFESLFGAADGTAFRTSAGLGDGRFVAMFAGMLGIAQALPTLLDAAQSLDGEADIAFVGDGPIRSMLVEDAQSRGLRNVYFLPQRPLDDMPEAFAASDTLIVSLSAHPTFASFVPSKLYDSMASGKPVVLAAAGEAARILEHAGSGIAVPPEDGEALAAAIRWLREHPEEAKEMGERGRAFAMRRLRSRQSARLEHVLLDVAR